MHWTELKITAKSDQAEIISQYLLFFGAESVTFSDAEDQPILEPMPGETPLWGSMWVTGLFGAAIDIKSIIAFLQKELDVPKLDYQIHTFEDRQWQTAWQDHFQPLCFGKRLWVCQEPGQINHTDMPIVILSPGLAFGTGSHPTTAMCLEWLTQQVKLNAEIIDYGCGSGILSIAALKLGAKKAYAIDIDPQALDAAEENARINQVSEKLIVASPDLLSLKEIKSDLLVANILAVPLMELAVTFAALIKENGVLGLSGILKEQVDQVCKSYKTFFCLDPVVTQGEWAFISGKKL